MDGDGEEFRESGGVSEALLSVIEIGFGTYVEGLRWSFSGCRIIKVMLIAGGAGKSAGWSSRQTIISTYLPLTGDKL